MAEIILYTGRIDAHRLEQARGMTDSSSAFQPAELSSEQLEKNKVAHQAGCVLQLAGHVGLVVGNMHIYVPVPGQRASVIMFNRHVVLPALVFGSVKREIRVVSLSEPGTCGFVVKHC